MDILGLKFVTLGYVGLKLMGLGCIDVLLEVCDLGYISRVCEDDTSRLLLSELRDMTLSFLS